MLFVKVLLFLVGLAPYHDFHTTIMNFKYHEEDKEFTIDLTLDTEHFNHVLNVTYGIPVTLGMEGDEHPMTDSLINDYLAKHIALKMNNKKKTLVLESKQVTFFETELNFKAICQRRKVKAIEMTNDLMLEMFPGQKNLVNFYYMDHAKSMLFDQENNNNRIQLN